MQLVGASDWFIKTPFLIGGIIQGLAGAIVALAVLRASYGLILLQLEDIIIFNIDIPEFFFLSPFAMVLVILLGVFVGAVGSVLAVRRFLDV